MAPRELPMGSDGVWPAVQALTRPLMAAAPAAQPHGAVVVGLNPRVPLDDAYVGFVEQVAREIATALDRVHRLAKERQSALAAAHAERALLEGVFALSPSFLAVLRGPEHVFELANPAYYQLIGHRPILGQRVRDALPEVAGQGFLELLDGVYRTGKPFVGNELPVQLQIVPDGALEGRYVDFVYQPMRDAGGAVTGILATGFDVTALVHEREAVEQARLDAERLAAERDIERRQLQTVLEQSPLAVGIVEAPSGRMVFANREFERIFGRVVLSEDARSYSDVYIGYHPDGRRIASDEWPGARVVQRGELVRNEIVAVERSDGQRLEININAAPVRDAAERVVAGVVFFSDVTEERRTARQLRDTQRLQAVGTLAGGVAHEINNQMTAVLGFGEFVLRALGPDHPQAPDMRLVLQAGRRAARVSQQLLAFTRQQVTQPRLLDLRAIVTDMQPVLQHLLGSDKLLSIAAVEGGAEVSADPDQVQQVLINLAANARDAAATGAEVRITVEPAVVESELPAALGEPVAPGRYVRLSVADTGSGMTAETLARIFDPFFTTKPVGKGTGLGLPMVYGTLRRHGGYVVAHSVPGAGTTMELYWPAAVAGGAGRGDGSEEDPKCVPGVAGSGLVVVAEDDPVVRALAVRALEVEGYRVIAAADGAEAGRAGAVHVGPHGGGRRARAARTGRGPVPSEAVHPEELARAVGALHAPTARGRAR